jgi:hypothetical protein
MSPSARGEHDASAQSISPSNSLDQVREILFGTYYRDFERKLGRLDAVVSAQAEELRADTRRLVQVLEAHVKRETEAVRLELESDRSAQMEAVSSATREAREAIAQLDHRIKKLDDGLARVQREFRQQMLDEGKAFVEQARRVREEIITMLHRELAMYTGESPEPLAQSGVVEAPRPPEPPTAKS